MTSNILRYKFKLLLFFIYLVPVIFLLWFTTIFSVNVPFMDQWSLVRLFEKVSMGTAGFGDFFVQHNEHRFVFPSAIMTAFAFISKWDIRYEIYFSILLAVITFYTTHKISLQEVKSQNYNAKRLTNILACVSIFSLVQYENWLWGFQLAFFLVNACLTLSILTIVLSHERPHKLYFAAIPCFIASFSLAHGLLSWLAVIPSVASLKGSSRQKWTRIIVWVLLFVGTCTVYFVGYQKPSNSPSLLFSLQNPLIAADYFFTLLGSAFTHNAIIAPIMGIIMFLFFLFASIYFVKRKPDFVINSDAAPWISLGLYAILFTLITTVGRAGFGVEQATSSRYTTSSLLLVVSTAHLWRLFSFRSSFFPTLL